MKKTNPPTYSGKLITIEGIEGAGKSTVLHFIQSFLQQKEQDIVVTREPGGTKIGEEIRKLLLHSIGPIKPPTELLLMFAARAEHISQCILPALQAGKYVLSDRYVDASYAYQGGGRGISLQHIAMLDQWVVNHLYPDLTLLLDIPVDLGFERADLRGKERDRIEQEKFEFFERVRQVYLERAQQAPQRIKIIDASQSLADVEEQLSEVLEAFIAQGDKA